MDLRRFEADSVLIKGGLIGLLTLLLLWPLGQISGLVAERAAIRDQARQTIAARIGARQWVAGPVLRVPVQRRRVLTSSGASASPTIQAGAVGAAAAASPATTADLPLWEDAEPLYLRSAELEVQGNMRAEDLRKGLHHVPTYEATLLLRGRFDAPGALSRSIDPASERLLWDEARVVLPLSALESIRRIERFTLDEASLETTGDGFLDQRALAGRAPLDEARRQKDLPFEIALTLSGSEALRLVPLSAASRFSLRGNWPHPDFDGAEATAARTVTAQGFDAQWTSTRLRWIVPPSWRGAALSAPELLAAASGVALFQPLDVYALNYRAVHYGVLFIAMTYLALFAWEYASRGVRLHAMQYLLVGLALAVFFLLLLALSEHVGFATAYALAATALVLLIGYYVAGVAASRRVAAVVAGALAAGYGLLYAILASEDQALLLGALTVFVALALLMIATRRFDWRTQRSPQAAPTADAAAQAIGW